MKMIKRLNILIFFTLFIIIQKDLFSNSAILPENSINFIKNYFDYEDIINVEKLNDLYKVLFSDGKIIYFNFNGVWEEVDGNSAPIPTDFIDENVINTIKKTNPNAAIMKIKKSWNMYIISLDNYINVFIDFAGMLIGQKIHY